MKTQRHNLQQKGRLRAAFLLNHIQNKLARSFVMKGKP